MSGAPPDNTVIPAAVATPAAAAVAPVAAPTPAATISPAAPVTPAPVSPAAAAPAAPIVAAEPAAPAPVPVAEPAKPAAEPAKPTSLLGDAVTGVTEPEKPAEGQQPAAEPAAPLPTYELKLPEGFEAAPEQMGKFNELIGKFEQTTGGDHTKFQEFGQQALDFHLSEMTRVAAELDKQSRQQWADTREEWKQKFKDDRELGGNRQNTTLAACKSMVDQFGGNAAQRAELVQMLGMTGMGDHPSLIRLLSNVAKALGEGRPVPAHTPKPVPMSRKEKRYNANGAA